MGRSISVLHVEDDADFADLARTFLEREDDRLEVETATDASEALERLSEIEFDCVVSDYDMHGRNGIELLEAVRAEYPDLPFILFTGKGSEDVASDEIDRIFAGQTDDVRLEIEPTYPRESAVVELRMRPIRIATGEELVLATTRDVTESRKRERQLEALFENAPVAIAYTELEDGKPIIGDVNAEFERVFGYGADEVVGRNLDELIVPEDASSEPDELNRRVRAGERIEEYVRRETADATREFLLHSVPFEPGERGTRSYAMYVDVTDRRDDAGNPNIDE